MVQRVLVGERSALRASWRPIIGAAFKMVVPFIVILPGLLALAVLPVQLVGEAQAVATGGHSYNEVLPLMLARYCGPGLLGLGITALIAGFMSGMAGNVSAFATVWTYDIYRRFMSKKATDAHYVAMGRWCTVLGVLVSIGTAYLVMQFLSIMDYVQALFSFFIAPLFGTVMLGMLWKRATPAGGFWGSARGNRVLDRDVGLGEGGSERVCAICALPECQGHGGEYVSCALVVDGLRQCHGRGQLYDCALDGRRTGGAGLRLYRHSPRGAGSPLPDAEVLGGCRCRGLRNLECHFLVVLFFGNVVCW